MQKKCQKGKTGLGGLQPRSPREPEGPPTGLRPLCYCRVTDLEMATDQQRADFKAWLDAVRSAEG
eukprot:1160773-Pelagomonas_calceolata.AAC.2